MYTGGAGAQKGSEGQPFARKPAQPPASSSISISSNPAFAKFGLLSKKGASSASVNVIPEKPSVIVPPSNTTTPGGPTTNKTADEWVKAKFEFYGENDAELNLKVGDVLRVISKEDEGWWEGEMNGRKGLFPSNYVEPCPAPSSSASTAFSPPSASSATSAAAASAADARNLNVPPPYSVAISTGPASNIPTPITSSTPGALPPLVQKPSLGLHSSQESKSQFATPAGGFIAPAAFTRVAGGSQISRQPTAETPEIRKQFVPSGPAVKGPVSSTAKKSITRFGLWAWNMGNVAGVVAMGSGAYGIFWWQELPGEFSSITLVQSIYCIAIGALTVIYEQNYGVRRTASRFPVRGLLYMAAAIFMFFSLNGILAGIFYILTGIVNFVSSCIMHEVYEPEKSGGGGGGGGDYVLQYHENFCDGIREWLTIIRQNQKIGEYVFLFLYFAANVALYGTTVNDWINMNTNLGPLAFSSWAPFAKGFGKMLDFNCAIILLPVCRNLLRMLYNMSTANQTCFAKTLRAILYFVPLDKNLAFHKLVAWVILFAAFGHITVHCVNLGLALTNTIAYFGYSPLISGVVVTTACFFIFTSAVDNVRRGHFEIFWYTHHFFLLFFVTLIFHGAGGVGPNYWKYFIGPGVLYFLERVLREYRARLDVPILSVTLMDEVFSLEIAKEGVFAEPYREGQYIFLNSPPISYIQWHPFTISSAPQENSVTVHIRAQGEGSWTRRLHQYVSNLGIPGRSFYVLDRTTVAGKIPGKLLGPDGRHILRVDGPYSAPTQHMSEYSVAMICGAGIGVTPVAACLKSVVFHRWRLFMGQTFPDHAYFYWVCAHKDIDAFRWLIRTIREAEDELAHLRATNGPSMATKSFEFHIFVTSAPKELPAVRTQIDDDIGFWGVPREDKRTEKVRSGWEELQLYTAMKAPVPGSHKQLGHGVHVWEGRPKWEGHFRNVGQKHAEQDIAVCFCGNPMIAKDLKKQCYLGNKPRTKGLFKLHKENF